MDSPIIKAESIRYRPGRIGPHFRTEEVDIMGQNRIMPLIALILIFIVLQPILIALDVRQTPAKVAKQFIQEYYYLDADMQKWLCANEGDPGQWVDEYLDAKSRQAAQMGFNISYMRRMFTHMKLETESQDPEKAVIRVEGTTRTAINPAFMVIGKMFSLGQNHPVDATLELVKVKGQWRVCKNSLEMLD